MTGAPTLSSWTALIHPSRLSFRFSIAQLEIFVFRDSKFPNGGCEGDRRCLFTPVRSGTTGNGISDLCSSVRCVATSTRHHTEHVEDEYNSEIEQSSGDIVEEIEKCKESAGAKSKILEEEKDRYQKAAMAVLQMLGGTDIP